MAAELGLVLWLANTFKTWSLLTRVIPKPLMMNPSPLILRIPLDFMVLEWECVLSVRRGYLGEGILDSASRGSPSKRQSDFCASTPDLRPFQGSIQLSIVLAHESYSQRSNPERPGIHLKYSAPAYHRSRCMG